MKFLKEFIKDFLYLWNLKYSIDSSDDRKNSNCIVMLITLISLIIMSLIIYYNKIDYLLIRIIIYYTIGILVIFFLLNIFVFIKNCCRNKLKKSRFSISDFLWKFLVIFLIPSIFLYEIMGLNIKDIKDEKISLIVVETLYVSLNSIIIVYIYNYIFLSLLNKLNGVIINKDFIINFRALSLILSFIFAKLIIEGINSISINRIIAWIYTKMTTEINIDLDSAKNNIKSRLEKLLYKLELFLLILTFLMVVISPLDCESLNTDIINSVTVITLLILFYDKNKEWK